MKHYKTNKGKRTHRKEGNTMTRREIYEVLEQRPDIKELFHEIISFPEEKRTKAMRIVTEYLEGKKNRSK